MNQILERYNSGELTIRKIAVAEENQFGNMLKNLSETMINEFSQQPIERNKALMKCLPQIIEILTNAGLSAPKSNGSSLPNCLPNIRETVNSAQMLRPVSLAALTQYVIPNSYLLSFCI